MTRSAAAIIVRRLLTADELAEYLGHSPGWFAQARPRLEAQGFPAPLGEIDRYDRAAVDRWLDTMSDPERNWTDVE